MAKREDPSEKEERLKRQLAKREKETKEVEYQRKLILRILELLQPMKGLGITRLSRLNTKELIKVGNAARVLSDIMSDTGIIVNDYAPKEQWD